MKSDGPCICKCCPTHSGPRADGPHRHGQLSLLREYAETGGDISHLLDSGTLVRMGTDAVREWRMDTGSRAQWLEHAEKYLNLAAQDDDDDDDKREPLWGDTGSNVDYPILSTACSQFLARASPELIKGDKVVGVKVFSPPAQKPDPIEQAKAGPQPQNDEEAQIAMAAIQQAQQAQAQASAMAESRNARAERVKHYMNWLIFYQMDDWEGDTDLLLLQCSAIGTGFKKVYMSPSGLKSEFLSSTCLTVNNNTKTLAECPRVTHEFEIFPNDIEEGRRSGRYRDIELPNVARLD